MSLITNHIEAVNEAPTAEQARFAARAAGPEIMDGADYTADELKTTLREIALINKLTRGYEPTLNAIAQVAKRFPGRKLKILDIGFGYGDTLRAIHQWAKKTGVRVELTGVDLNPLAKKYAEAETPEDFGIRYITSDIFDCKDVESDIMINALFMHHLDDDQIVRLVKWMNEHARIGWFVNDLHRHPVAYHFIKQTTRLFRFNRLIRNDAPLSVARGFTKNDWLQYLQKADIDPSVVDIEWHLPFRFGVFGHSLKTGVI